jgi:hypothetical protein
VVDSTLKALQYYSLETWFLHSPNPLIPHDVNVRSLLEGTFNYSSLGSHPEIFARGTKEDFGGGL